MSKEKILRDHFESLIYSKSDWTLLELKRVRAANLLKMFEGLTPYIYGSVARGNVHKNSDIDIIFTEPIQSFRIELILNKNGFKHYFREIIMATPKDSIKLYIYLSELESITVPLTKFDKKTLEFYDFGGKINLNELNLGMRRPGIDKRLVLIKPNQQGHDEFSIIDNEAMAAKELGITIDTILERKKVLLKREKHGRTGVFLKRELDINESTEEVLKKLSDKKAIIRKKLYQK